MAPTISDERVVPCGELDSPPEVLMDKYPKWYGMVRKAVKGDGNAKTGTEGWPALWWLGRSFAKNTTKSAFEIYKFFKLLECDEIGKQFIDTLKAEKRDVLVTTANRSANVGRFIGTILFGETIFGTPNIHEYRAKNGIPTIIFGPNTDCVLIGGDSFDFLFGGDGNDTLCGTGDIVPRGHTMDVLAGGDGDDTYLFPGSGTSYIYENNTIEAGNNIVQMGEGIKPEDLRLHVTSTSLYITTKKKTMPLQTMFVLNWTPRVPVPGYFNRYNCDSKIVEKYPPIRKIIFSDGTELGVEDILKLIKS